MYDVNEQLKDAIRDHPGYDVVTETECHGWRTLSKVVVDRANQAIVLTFE